MNKLLLGVIAVYISYDQTGLQVSYPREQFNYENFYNKSDECQNFPSGFSEDYDPRCWSFYIETKKAFPHIILTNPYFNLLNGTLASYIGTLGKALAFPNKTGSPA